MTEPLRPASTKVYGRENWLLVLTIASTAAPTAVEINAVSALDVTRILFASTGKPAQSTNRVTAERRYGDTSQFERIGSTSYTGGDMLYQFSAQGATGSDGKKLFEKIPEGTSAFLVQRLGVPRATTPAAGQFVNVFPVEFGPSMPTTTGDQESAEAAAMCSFAVTDTPVFNVVVA